MTGDMKVQIVKDSKGDYVPCVMCGRSFPPPDAARITGRIGMSLWQIKRVLNRMTTIARVTNIELLALRELRTESLRESFRFVERLCEEWTSEANRFCGRGEALFVAVADDQVVGVCGLNCDP